MESFLARFMPPDASAHGPQLDHITVLLHWLMAILFAGWLAYFVFALFRFRASKNPRASHTGAKKNWAGYAEAGVVAFESILLIGFAIPAWSRWVTPAPPAVNPLEIRVVAEQFAWDIHYPGPDGVFGRTAASLVSPTNAIGLDRTDPFARDDVATINELHLQVNRAVNIRLSSKDVVHSFSLPVMRVKQDAIPGMAIPVHFTPVRVSGSERWDIACAQLCGLAHYRMRGNLVVETKPDFEKWLAANAPQPR